MAYQRTTQVWGQAPVTEIIYGPGEDLIVHALESAADRLSAFRDDLPSIGIREDFNDDLIVNLKVAAAERRQEITSKA
jgi:hypothetical protein